MKKIIARALSAVMALSMVACGGKSLICSLTGQIFISC